MCNKRFCILRFIRPFPGCAQAVDSFCYRGDPTCLKSESVNPKLSPKNNWLTPLIRFVALCRPNLAPFFFCFTVCSYTPPLRRPDMMAAARDLDSLVVCSSLSCFSPQPHFFQACQGSVIWCEYDSPRRSGSKDVC